ncbi:MAG: type II toxin-antitoxin system VapC family toxin [Rhodanobacteraceae bacterium]
MAAGCLLDTSFLITLSDAGRPRHPVARQYFEYCVQSDVPLYLPTLVAMEFYRKQTLDKLGLHDFIILPLNFDEAVKAAEFAEQCESLPSTVAAERPAVKVDIALLAQAHLNGIDVILTEDEKTLKRFCDILRERQLLRCHALLLAEGFDPERLADPAAPGLVLPQPDSEND